MLHKVEEEIHSTLLAEKECEIERVTVDHPDNGILFIYSFNLQTVINESNFRIGSHLLLSPSHLLKLDEISAKNELTERIDEVVFMTPTPEEINWASNIIPIKFYDSGHYMPCSMLCVLLFSDRFLIRDSI